VNDGILNLTGGTFDNNGYALDNDGQISGHGILRAGGLTNDGSVTLTGGSTTVNGNVTNSAGRTIEAIGDAVLFTGNVTNFGLFKNSGASVTFAATYLENGTYFSDPADNYFNDIVLGESGSLIGGAGDRFFVANDLLSVSFMDTMWSTGEAELILQSSADHSHTLQYTGADRGSDYAGYLDNFAWGAFELAAGESLVLLDGDTAVGGALYTRDLRLGGGLAQIASIIGNGLSLYYDPLRAANAYLGGQTYALSGGGSLAPVPELGTGLLLAVGLIALAARRRTCPAPH